MSHLSRINLLNAGITSPLPLPGGQSYRGLETAAAPCLTKKKRSIAVAKILTPGQGYFLEGAKPTNFARASVA